MKPIVICITGSPASGERTQAWNLSQALKIPQATIGRLLGRMAKRNDDLGRELRDAIERGNALGDHFFEAVLQELLTNYAATSVIIDGFPLSKHQANLLLEYLPKMSQLIVIDLYLDEKETINRIRKHKETNAITHVAESEEVIEERFFVHTITHPALQRVLEKASKKSAGCHYVRIHGAGTVEEVQAKIRAFTDQLLQ